ELIQAAVAFATQPIPAGPRVGIITNTGGPAVIATDVMVAAGLTLPPLSEKTETALKGALFPEASVANPVDVLATGTAQHYRACLDAMMEDDHFDCVMVHFVTPFFVDTDSIAREIAAVNRQRKKPLVCNLMTDRRQWTETVRILSEGGVPCFALPGEAARALGALVRYRKILDREKREVKPVAGTDPGAAAKILEAAKNTGRTMLLADEVYNILGAYGIPVPEWKMAADADQAARAAAGVGFPVVVKADAPSVIHKSDVGGVALNLADEESVRQAVETMKRKLAVSDLRFFVQRQLPEGLEMILGARAEEGLGHAVMFGLGGIFVEVLKDVVFKLTPVSGAEAREMLSGIKGAALLDGVRGRKGIDREAVVDTIVRLSQLLTDLPQIREMDLNPVLAYEDRVAVADARILI
ncbi:MAG: acetate--CoA ligase family protein, partial [Desulfobacterales bacterium]